MRQKAVFRNNRQDSVKNDQIFTELSSPKKKRNTVNFMEESPDRHSSANLQVIKPKYNRWMTTRFDKHDDKGDVAEKINSIPVEPEIPKKKP